MQLKIIHTDDGSNSVYNEKLNEIYHSRHGAIQESLHVFINAGLKYIKPTKNLSILEIGFGTGLNALLTLQHKVCDRIRYTALEPEPLPNEIIRHLNYPTVLGKPELNRIFQLLHSCPWNQSFEIDTGFFLEKHQKKVQEFEAPFDQYHLVYFDAFAPSVQPELWTLAVFSQIYHVMHPQAILVTYSAVGAVRRSLQSAGFTVERLQGPKGKREMLRAIK
ncbi:MAG: tRNA (5-methylaminomethyl-2-thiouridine)(34)-methyltransferase MnmD [Bacteroidetes bacterium]|nr:tRNA (5-methylaminomethyl-2-thiouridine)(34)-methyltransferase MnmD [Bacteroidota bacterium]